MSQSHRSLAARLKEIKQRHSERNRVDGELQALLGDIQARAAEMPGDGARLALLAADAWGQLSQTSAALTACAEAARAGDLQVGDAALTLALRIVRNARSRVFSHDEPGGSRERKLTALRGLVEELCAVEPESDLSRELWWRYLLEIRAYDEILISVGDEYRQRRDPVSLGRVLETLYRQFEEHKDPRFILKGLDYLAADLPSGVAPDAFPAGLSLVCAAHEIPPRDPSLRRIARDRGAFSPVAFYRAAAPDVRTRQALQLRQIWSNVYDEDEDLKRSVVDDMLLECRRFRRPPGRDLWAALSKAATTRSFWSDAACFDHVTRTITRLVPWWRKDPLHRWSIAAIKATAADFAGAERLYRSILADGEAGAKIGRNGAICFIARAHEAPAAYDEADPLLSPGRTLAFHGRAPSIPSGPRLVCCADSRYFLRYAPRYAKSLRGTGSQLPVHFHVAGPTAEALSLATALERRDPGISTSFEEPQSRKPYYFSALRFLRARRFLEWFGGDVLLTDIDVMFHQAPEHFLRHPLLHESDAALRIYDAVRVVETAQMPRLVYRYPRLLPWAHVNAACLLLRNTAGGIRLAELIAAEMVRHLDHVRQLDSPIWFIDQTALFAALRNARRTAADIRIANVEDIGMPFGGFRLPPPDLASPPVGSNPCLR